MATQQEIVEAAAEKFAEAEQHLRQAQVALHAIPPLFKDGNQAGMAGYLRSSRMAAQVKAAAGLAAQAEALIFQVHEEGTDIAQKLGVDLPVIEGSGGR